MDSRRYIREAKVTESQDNHAINGRLLANDRLIHASLGLTTEVGELVDAAKKAIFYGKPMDVANVIEEVGDIFWYLAIVADQFDFTFEEAMETNINKLRARYGDKFTEFDALNRNLGIEREILETRNVVKETVEIEVQKPASFDPWEALEPLMNAQHNLGTVMRLNPPIGNHPAMLMVKNQIDTAVTKLESAQS